MPRQPLSDTPEPTEAEIQDALTQYIEYQKDHLVHGAHRFEPRYESRCKICQLIMRRDLPNATQVRHIIDSRGWSKSWPEVQNLIVPLMEEWPEEEHIKRDSFHNHRKKHLVDGRVAAAVQIVEKVNERRKDFDAERDDYIDTHGLLSLVKDQVARGLANGELEVKVKDGVEAAKALFVMEQQAKEEEEGSYTVEDAKADAYLVLQTAYGMIPASRHEEFKKRLQQGYAKLRALPEPDEVEAQALEDAEVVPDAS